MKFVLSQNLYSDMASDKSFQKLLNKIVKKRPVATGLFLVTKPVFNAGIMEIYDYNELLQPFYRKRKADLNIYGVSTSRAGAREIVKDIIEDAYDALGELDIEKFFSAG